MSIIPTSFQEDKFLNALAEVGFKVIAIERDGNCMFRAVAHQLYGDQSGHEAVRKQCCDYLDKEREFFQNYCFDESLDQRLTRMRRLGTWGDNIELQALSELFKCSIEVYYLNNWPVMIYSSRHEAVKPVRLYYRNNCHYDSIVDTETAYRSEDIYGVRRQQSIIKHSNDIPVISRQNSDMYARTTVDQILKHSLATIETDESRMTKTAMQESHDQAIEDQLLRMAIEDSKKQNFAPESLYADTLLSGQPANSHSIQSISTKDFGVYKFALSLGYTMELAMQAHFKFEPQGSSVDADRIVDFLLQQSSKTRKK